MTQPGEGRPVSRVPREQERGVVWKSGDSGSVVSWWQEAAGASAALLCLHGLQRRYSEPFRGCPAAGGGWCRPFPTSQ